MSSTVFAQIEIVPISGDGSSGPSYVFNDVMQVDTNKSALNGQAGNFSAKFATEHGIGILSDIRPNDVALIYMRRGDNNFTSDDLVYAGQIDRASRVGDPSRVDCAIRGKCLTKQLLTQVLYVRATEEGEGGETLLTPKTATYQTLATELKVEIADVKVPDLDTPVKGVPLGPFLRALFEDNKFLDADLFFEPFYIDPELDYSEDSPNGLIILNNDVVSYQTLWHVVEGLADRPFYYWYVSERGQPRFRKWSWRRIGDSPEIITEADYLNDYTSFEDFGILSSVMVTGPFAAPGDSILTSIQFDETLLHRYGMRFADKQDVLYVYTAEQTKQRAVDEVQMSYAKAFDCQLSVNGSSRWFVDIWAYVERLASWWFVDTVQHRFYYDEGGEVHWDTNLGLLAGRWQPDAYEDNDKTAATIAAQQGKLKVPLGLDARTLTQVIGPLSDDDYAGVME